MARPDGRERRVPHRLAATAGPPRGGRRPVTSTVGARFHGTSCERGAPACSALHPTVDGSDPSPATRYPPGVRENAGQYSHAAVWAAMALARRTNERAAALVSLLNPINYALTRRPSSVTRPSPTLAATSTVRPCTSVGALTRYTARRGGSPMLYEVVFDRTAGRHARFRPRVHVVDSLQAHYRYFQTFYHLVFRQYPEHPGPTQLTVTGTF